MTNLEKIRKSLSRRNRAEGLFRWAGRVAIFLGLMAVVVLFVDIIGKGHGAFRIAYIELDIDYDPEKIGIENLSDPQQLAGADW